MEYLLNTNVNLNEAQRKQAEQLHTELGLQPLLSELLVARGQDTPAAAERFLHPRWQDLHDPYLFRDMAKAVSLIRKTIAAGEKIWVHGDYDADGTSAAAIMVRGLSALGANVSCYIPSRTGDGYGLSMNTIESLGECALLITVDCGISNLDEIARARELGMRTIVTDHHTCPDLLPEADAILNPKASGETFPDPELCGAGVAFKLIQALADDTAAAVLDLAALGTIADVVPLSGENRVLVSLGLKKMDEHPNPGLGALWELQKRTDHAPKAEDIAFRLAPCINAAGRMSSARLAYDLMVEDRLGSARILARTLHGLNGQRQARQQEIIQQVEAQIAGMKELPAVIVLHDSDWETGLVGLAAGYVCETYSRPALLLGTQGAMCVGSARSIPGFDIYEALKSAEALLVKFGGHAQAAGVTMEETAIELLAQHLNERAAGLIKKKGRPVADYDVEVTLPIADAIMDAFDAIEPCGNGNPRPRVLVRNARIENCRSLTGGRHSAFSLVSRKGRMDALMFRTSVDELPPCADVVGTLGRDRCVGAPQLLVDLLSTDDSDDQIFRELSREVRAERLPEAPSRFHTDKQRLGLIYSALRASETKHGPLGWRQLYHAARGFIPGLSKEEFVFAICVFAELKLLAGAKGDRIQVIADAPKRRLEDSIIFGRFEGE